jgi:carboxylesterase type B
MLKDSLIPLTRDGLVDEEDGASSTMQQQQSTISTSTSCAKNVALNVVGLMLSIGIVWLIAIAASRYSPGHGQTAVSPYIVTEYGPVQGFAYVANNSNEYIAAWKGIPFAEPPIGDLRWRAPQRISQPWNDTLDTTKLKPACVQSDGSGSEDCLYLNIYRNLQPSDSAITSTYPVMFYIYGGGLMFGQANGNYDSLITANDNEGLVVVEVAYRLNAFGFMALSELSEEQEGSSGNYGIMDQLLALRWVQNNIIKFGGDPTRVTLAGQSSGGTSIMALLSAPSSYGLYAGAISMSGSINISMPLGVAEAQNAHFVDNLCSSSSSSEAVMACMRGLSVTEIVSQIPSAWLMPGIWNLPLSQQGQHYEGLVVVDGAIIPHDFPTALSLGLVDVPFIFGNMQAEPDEGPEMDVSAYNLTGWASLLNTTFSSWTIPGGTKVAPRLNQLYQQAASENPQKAFDEIVSDYGLYCGQVSIARQALSPLGSYQSPIYIYEDQWGLSQQYISPWTDTVVKYPFHDTFFFMVTGQWNQVGEMGSYQPSSRDLQGQALLQGIWRYFLKFQTLAGSGYGWEPVDNDPNWGSSSSIGNPLIPYGNYSVFVIDPAGSQTVVNHKLDVCTFFHSVGLDREKFWWAN